MGSGRYIDDQKSTVLGRRPELQLFSMVDCVKWSTSTMSTFGTLMFQTSNVGTSMSRTLPLRLGRMCWNVDLPTHLTIPSSTSSHSPRCQVDLAHSTWWASVQRGRPEKVRPTVIHLEKKLWTVSGLDHTMLFFWGGQIQDWIQNFIVFLFRIHCWRWLKENFQKPHYAEASLVRQPNITWG